MEDYTVCEEQRKPSIDAFRLLANITGITLASSNRVAYGVRHK